jgi:hypothetical protein
MLEATTNLKVTSTLKKEVATRKRSFWQDA